VTRSWPIEECAAWREWTTPKGLHEKPVHRWYIFPHSYTNELVHALIDEWNLGEGDKILDPFAGAGTTVLGAKERGIGAVGCDLSPLAVLAARTKIAGLALGSLENLWRELQPLVDAQATARKIGGGYPALVRKALPVPLLSVFDAIKRVLAEAIPDGPERDFFLLGLLATIPTFSRAQATGGWLSWVDNRRPARLIPETYAAVIARMLEDVPQKQPSVSKAQWVVRTADARKLPDPDGTYTGVITSPPYPNRHDYTRVFGVELMFGFLDWEETRELRHQSFQSHPEARPERNGTAGYRRPEGLAQTVREVDSKSNDRRVARMLDGYFLDMFLCLSEVNRVCRPGARAAFVVGNAQYSGIPLLVDEYTADAGEQAGLECERIVAVRHRGNSAQQMGRHGRSPSRESIVVFRKP
jgi:tRNA G10  N-methylase Trm11